MPLSAIKHKARCDVNGCDCEHIASLQQLSTAGWNGRHLFGGAPELRPISQAAYAVVCPSCSMRGFWREMQIPVANQTQERDCSNCAGDGYQKVAGVAKQPCETCGGTGKVTSS